MKQRAFEDGDELRNGCTLDRTIQFNRRVWIDCRAIRVIQNGPIRREDIFCFSIFLMLKNVDNTSNLNNLIGVYIQPDNLYQPNPNHKG